MLRGARSAVEDVTMTVAKPPDGAHISTPRFAAADVGGRGAPRYLMIEEVARGSTTVVARAYDTRLRREVALETTQTLHLTAEDRGRVLGTARAMAQVSHPNVVAVYDVEATDEAVVVAMEYVRGTPLDVWLQQPRTVPEVVRIFVAMGRGWVAARPAGLVQSQLEPARVLVDERHRVRVTALDLLASVDGGDTDPVHEQRFFCAALWEALTGSSPFSSSDSGAACETEGTRASLQWPRHVAAPAALRVALFRGLGCGAGERWPSFSLLLDALEHAVQMRRRPWLLTSAILVTLGSASWTWNVHLRQREARCSGARAQLEGAWDPERREEINTALVNSGIGYAADVWQRVEPQLDGYASAWAAMHTDACEAATIRGEQTPEIMDLRMACLQRARVGLFAATELLAKADAQIIEHAQEVMGGLQSLERCADVEALQTEVAPPASTDAAAVEAVRAELAEIKALREAGKYPETRVRMMALADRAALVGYSPLQTEVMLELGLAHGHAHADVEAEAAFKRALRLALGQKQWPEAAAAASHLIVVVGVSRTRPAEGLAHAHTVEGLLRRADRGAEADLHRVVGTVLQSLGRYPEAETELRAAVKLGEDVWGRDSLVVASYRGDLGDNLRRQGRFEDAEREQRAKLMMQEAILGAEHPDVARARCELSQTLHVQWRNAEAEAELRKALAVHERTLGANHLETVATRLTLAGILSTEGNLAEAEAHTLQAFAVQRELLGRDHLQVAATHATLGQLSTTLGRHAEGEAHLRESLAISERLLGTRHPDVAAIHFHLGSNLLRQAGFAASAEEARAALAIFETTKDYEHSYRALSHNLLAVALTSQRLYEEADREFRAALEWGRKTWGPDHSHVGRLLMSHAANLSAMKRHAEAEPELREALRLQTEALGREHPHVLTTRGRLASTLREQGRHTEAEAEYRDAIALQMSLPETEHPELAELRFGYAETLFVQRKFSAARPIVEHLWQVWKDDVRVVLRVRAQMGLMLAKLLWRTPRARERARAAARAAHDLVASKAESYAREIAVIRQWLRTH